MNIAMNLMGRSRLPVTLQTEAVECGLACLEMISAYHGLHVRLSELRHTYPISAKGMTLASICQVAEALNLTSRPLRLDLEEMAQLQLPAILHWDMNHFVVLRSFDGRCAVIHDPAHGVEKVNLAQLSKRFTGVAVEMRPALTFKRRPRQASMSLGRIVGTIVGLKRSLFQFFALALALEVLSILSPVISQWVTDEATLQGDSSLLTTLCLVALGAAVLSSVLGAMRAWVGLYASTHFNLQWLSNVMSHLLSLPMEYFERRHLGDIVSRFGSVGTITHTLTSSAIEAILDGMLAVGTLVMIFVYSPVMGVAASASCLLYVLLRAARYGSLKLASSKVLTQQAKEQTYFLETIRGVRSIKLFSKERERKDAWLGLWINSVNSSVGVQKINLGFSTIWSIVASSERIGILWIGSNYVITHKLTLGMLFALVAFKEQFSARANALVDRVVEMKMLSIATERLADIVLTSPEQSMHRFEAQPIANFDLEIKNLRFRYGKDEPMILDQASARIAAGECIAIIGPSGAGKTTLFKLMLGLLQPSSGSISLGGSTLNKVGMKNYRGLIGTVMQDDQLFAGSIMENITFMAAKPDIEHVYRCCAMARISGEILAMPMGYHTLVGDMGSTLSGGQKQRILLARALYKNPKILFLDEATSHLDVDSEREIGDAIKSLAMTRIMIAHRPQTIQIADRILRFEGGKLVEVDRSAYCALESTALERLIS